MTFGELGGRTGFGARLFRLRWLRLGLSQAAFAERFGLTHGQVRDLEQNRTAPPRAVVLVVAAIEETPERMAKLAEREGLAGGARA